MLHKFIQINNRATTPSLFLEEHLQLPQFVKCSHVCGTKQKLKIIKPRNFEGGKKKIEPSVEMTQPQRDQIANMGKKELTERIVFVRRELRGSKLGEHLSRVFEGVSEIVGVLRQTLDSETEIQRGLHARKIRVFSGISQRGG